MDGQQAERAPRRLTLAADDAAVRTPSATGQASWADGDAAWRPGAPVRADRDAVARRTGAPVRASDADRDAVARMLGTAFAEGRLDVDEHGERVRAAYAARTLHDLDSLTEDLPRPARDDAAAVPSGLDSWQEKCLMCALLVCCPPAGIIWLLMARAKSRSALGQRPAEVAVWGRGAADAKDH